MDLKKFIIYYILYSAFLAGIALLLPVVFPGVTRLVPKFWGIFVFLAGITFIAYIVAYLGINRSPETGTMTIMGSITLKLLFCMAFVLIYSLKSKGNGLIFIGNFFSLYLLYSFFEIYCLLCNLRHQNK